MGPCVTHQQLIVWKWNVATATEIMLHQECQTDAVLLGQNIFFLQFGHIV